MRRWIGPLLAVALMTVVTHILTLQLTPGIIMTRALDLLEERGVALHRFTTPERITPQTQSVVRSSPDLYYALCRYDLSKARNGLHLRMQPWRGYQSLAFFDAETDNFATIRGDGPVVGVQLLPPGSKAGKGAIVSPTTTGVVLIRRLAPDAAQFAAAAQVGKADMCQPI
ncbi:DUF1254 domain-containing protein [Erythrobacter sp. R86502]|uniref:DUF1254 domain-containing protein n=1 Tax=Erythrobacter sp. R86502 TaxID=3093846 RepID=UPI0036D2B0E4